MVQYMSVITSKKSVSLFVLSGELTNFLHFYDIWFLICTLIIICIFREVILANFDLIAKGLLIIFVGGVVRPISY